MQRERLGATLIMRSPLETPFASCGITGTYVKTVMLAMALTSFGVKVYSALTLKLEQGC